MASQASDHGRNTARPDGTLVGRLAGVSDSIRLARGSTRDDVLSTGGTIVPIVDALKEMGVEIVDIVIVVNKNRNLPEMEARIGHKIKVLVTVDINDGKVVILD